MLKLKKQKTKKKGKRNYPFGKYERSLQKKGFSFVCGADEVGRGPWAGPITACAVINLKSPRPRQAKRGGQISLRLELRTRANLKNFGVRDSKKLTEKKREEIFDRITSFSSIKYYIAWVSAKRIDKIGLGAANQLVLKKAVEGLKKKIKRVDCALVDGFEIKGLKIPQKKIIKGDEKVTSISTASILAKVSRDRYMRKLAEKYPRYGFEKNKGYGTRKHLAALRKFGICPEHRRSFKPIKRILNIKYKK